MVLEDKVKNFKKIHTGDVMGVVRTLFPDIEVETVLGKKKKKKS